MTDCFDLQRFVTAQQDVHETVLDELRAGNKRGHWMWFVFPQIAGLGSSAMAARYAIASEDEARAYLAHPLLGARLREVTRAMIAHAGRPLPEILGTPDDLKFRSSMTLFAQVADADDPFATALDLLCDGEADAATLARLGHGAS